MIEQLHYTTTSRYNFPQTLEELKLPKRFIELSLRTMQNARGKHFQPYSAEYSESFIESPQFDEEPINLEGKVISEMLTTLKPIRDETTIIGIDVSSIKIGETETGILCAIRGAVVWNEKRHYKYLRLGPFPFHITEENKIGIFSLLGQYTSANFTAESLPLFETQNRLCNLIERWMQMNLSKLSHDSVILWDGSLTAGTPGNPVSLVSQILKYARDNLNSVLSFSKATTARFLGRKITDLTSKHKPPCLFEVGGLPISISKTSHLLGKIYVAKLSEGGCSFRLDIDRALPSEFRLMAVQKLLGNELLFQGYPETLRLAHIFSTFTANEIVGIQRFITQEYGLKIATCPSIRKTLFGPFGTGFGD
ncbi:MAG: hypothetical protein QXX08_03920 [Candidatus Bathyarchaeia archaeon]